MGKHDGGNGKTMRSDGDWKGNGKVDRKADTEPIKKVDPAKDSTDKSKGR